ncbi:hypothetical protein [uncultured Succinatimonas sp.]|uniref:hypothetical protein n=1 Tax=uncultured Succinatimonas sp. TaxID=1262973 RepID=UPI0025CDEA79|nr:hypothetical protein [uncultured Succinatimonas sp.]
MLDKNLLFGFAAGCVLGAVGYKFYNEHKDDIDEKIKGLKNFKVPGVNDTKEEKTDESNEEMTLEELEAQKERLEDLIAEMQANRKDNV